MQNGTHDNLVFLFSRLLWPSVIVRERSCTAIAELLIDTEQGASTLTYLKDWAKKQKLESIAILALLVLLRAKILNQSYVLPSIIELLEIIDKPSILSYWLLKELGFEEIPEPVCADMSLPDCPDDFTSSRFFEKYCVNYLPPIYKTHAMDIERVFGLPFYKHWAFEWGVILEGIGKKPSSEPLNYMGRPDDYHHCAVDLLLSDVYRSSYLRSLAWAANKDTFPKEEASRLALKTCPIDPSLWKVTSLAKPMWWPSPKSSSEIIDTVTSDTWKQVAALWDGNQKVENDWLVTQASGRICQANSVYDLEIRGAFQKCDGKDKPELRDVFSGVKYNLAYITSSIGLDGYLGKEPIDKYRLSIGDWTVLPAVCQIWPYTTPRWQSRRLFRGVWVPFPFLTDEAFELKCKSDSLDIIEDSDVIAQWRDWNWNFKEKINANLSPSTGEYLKIQKTFIDEFTKKYDYNFCWICKLTNYHRTHSYQEYKENHYFNDYGTSNIIIS